MGLSKFFEPPKNGILELTIIFKLLKLNYFIVLVVNSILILASSTSTADIEGNTSIDLLSHRQFQKDISCLTILDSDAYKSDRTLMILDGDKAYSV
jgi:hypothetical protein